jgi:hypothetical protein
LDVATRGLLVDIEAIWLDRGYDSDVTRTRLIERGIDDVVIAKQRNRTPEPPSDPGRIIPTATKKQPIRPAVAGRAQQLGALEITV